MAGRELGERNGRNLVERSWTRLRNNCAQVERLANIISELPIAPPSRARGNEFAACFYVGYTDAIWDRLGDVYMGCGNACFNAGAEIGEISAAAYCAVSTILGGLDNPGFIRQPDLPFCGTNVVVGCKVAYVDVATSSCPRYTDGRFYDTFENTVRQDCYVPSNIPIRDRGGYGFSELM